MILKYFRKNQTPPPDEKPVETSSFFSGLWAGLAKTRAAFTQQFRQIFAKNTLDEVTVEQLETLLLSTDVGLETTEHILQALQQATAKMQTVDQASLLDALADILLEILKPSLLPAYQPQHTPSVILLVGVNGAGKTTTIGRLAAYFQSCAYQVLMAAGDTYRAAAIEQLKIWGQRSNTEVIAQHSGADSASVIYDAYQSTLSKKTDILLADTAGRLHTKTNLMHELAKIKRVLGKLDEHAPHETWLVLDACTGQNGLEQAKKFHQYLDLTGIILTKLDGTARGGIVFAISRELNLPIRFIGTGEKVTDLHPFVPADFVNVLLNRKDEEEEQRS